MMNKIREYIDDYYIRRVQVLEEQIDRLSKDMQIILDIHRALHLDVENSTQAIKDLYSMQGFSTGTIIRDVGIIQNRRYYTIRSIEDIRETLGRKRLLMLRLVEKKKKASLYFDLSWSNRA